MQACLSTLTICASTASVAIMEVSQSPEVTTNPTIPNASSTTAPPRMVGEPPSAPVFFGSGIALFVAIAAFGMAMRKRNKSTN
jgi:hypothetical protein